MQFRSNERKRGLRQQSSGGGEGSGLVSEAGDMSCGDVTLLAAGGLVRTVPDRTNSRNQKYITARRIWAFPA